MLLTRVKEAYRHGVKRLNTSSREEAWPVILRTDGIWAVRSGRVGNDRLIKLATLGPEHEVQFLEQIELAQTVKKDILEGVGEYLKGKDSIANPDSRYRLAHNGSTFIVQLNPPEDTNYCWIDVNLVDRLGTIYAHSNLARKPTPLSVGDHCLIPLVNFVGLVFGNSDVVYRWEIVDDETQDAIQTLSGLNEKGEKIDPVVAAGSCATYGNRGTANIRVVNELETYRSGGSDQIVLHVEVQLESEEYRRIGRLHCTSNTSYYQSQRAISAGRSSDLSFQYHPDKDLVLSQEGIAKLIGAEVWMDTQYSDGIPQNERDARPRRPEPIVVLDTTFHTQNGFNQMMRVRIYSKNDAGESVVSMVIGYGERESTVGLLVDSGTKGVTHYVPQSAAMPSLEEMSKMLGTTIILHPSAATANVHASPHNSAYRQVHGTPAGSIDTQHLISGPYGFATANSAWGEYEAPARALSAFSSHRPVLNIRPVANSFFSDVALGDGNEVLVIRFLGNTPEHLLKTALFDISNLFVLKDNVWTPIVVTDQRVMEAILSVSLSTMPTTGFNDVWVGGVNASVNFQGNARFTTLSKSDQSGFVHQVALTTPMYEVVDIKKYL